MCGKGGVRWRLDVALNVVENVVNVGVNVGVQGWRSGESTRLPPMWPGFDSQIRRHMWVEFVGSLLGTERLFSGYSGFPSSQKPTFDLFCVNC